MSRTESAKRLMRRWLTSIPFFIVLGLILGGLISIPVIQKPKIATITISGGIFDQAHVDGIVKMLRYAKTDNSIKAVVLRINSPGGGAVLIEQIYLDVLRLRYYKPVVASIGAWGASGGYHIAVASNFIHTQPTSQLGSIAAWCSLPPAEKLDEDIVTTGQFKATGVSKRKALSGLEMVRQQFVDAVITQRGNRLKKSEEELSRGEIYSGIESLKYGLIDDIGTSSDAIAKAAELARVRNYEVVELYIFKPSVLVFDMEYLKSQTSTMPIYYYLHFESE